jgi:hypothetical protein
MKSHHTPQTLASFVQPFTLLPTMVKHMRSHHHDTADA